MLKSSIRRMSCTGWWRRSPNDACCRRAHLMARCARTVTALAAEAGVSRTKKCALIIIPATGEQMRNSRLLLVVLLLSILTTAPSQNAEAQDRLVSSSEHLILIEKNIEAIRRAVAQIDITALKVSYDEGKLMERRLKLVQSRLNTADTWIASLKRKDSLLGEFSLAVTLESLHASMEGLEWAAERRSVQSAEALLDSREPLF